MSGIARLRNIGAYVVPVTSIDPQSSAAATINGTGIDLQAHGVPGSLVLHQRVGALGGAPSTTSVVTKLQDSADNSTFADYVDPDTGVVAATPAGTAASTGARVNVDLSNARRYVRAVMTVAFTGGTSPTALVFAAIVVGGEPANVAI